MRSRSRNSEGKARLWKAYHNWKVTCLEDFEISLYEGSIVTVVKCSHDESSDLRFGLVNLIDVVLEHGYTFHPIYQSSRDKLSV